MKKYDFRLKALLKMCEHQEKERQKELAASQRKVNRQLEQLRQLGHQKDNTYSKRLSAEQKPFTVAEMLVYSRYIHKLKRESLMGEQMLSAFREEEVKKREKLLEAAREKKKYEKLKEKEQQKFYKEYNRQLNLEADETAITNFRRKS